MWEWRERCSLSIQTTQGTTWNCRLPNKQPQFLSANTCSSTTDVRANPHTRRTRSEMYVTDKSLSDNCAFVKTTTPTTARVHQDKYLSKLQVYALIMLAHSQSSCWIRGVCCWHFGDRAHTLVKADLWDFKEFETGLIGSHSDLVNECHAGRKVPTLLLAELVSYLSSFCFRQAWTNDTHFKCSSWILVLLHVIIGCSQCHRYQQRKSAFPKRTGRDLESSIICVYLWKEWWRRMGSWWRPFPRAHCRQGPIKSPDRRDFCCLGSFLRPRRDETRLDEAVVRIVPLKSRWISSVVPVSAKWFIPHMPGWLNCVILERECWTISFESINTSLGWKESLSFQGSEDYIAITLVKLQLSLFLHCNLSNASWLCKDYAKNCALKWMRL